MVIGKGTRRRTRRKRIARRRGGSKVKRLREEITETETDLGVGKKDVDTVGQRIEGKWTRKLIQTKLPNAINIQRVTRAQDQ